MFAVVTVDGWAEIEAMRAKRRAPAKVSFKADPMREARVALASELADPRLPSNLAPHVEALLSADQRAGLTKARAAKARAKAMAACPCRLCALALRPPQTFADAERFGTASIGAESRGLLFGVHRWPEREKRQPPRIDADGVTG